MGASEQQTLDEYRRRLSLVATRQGLTSARTGDRDLYEMALAVIRMLAQTGRVFSSVDVRHELAGVSGNAIGSAFRTLASAGEIYCVGLATSTTPSRHGSLIRTWAGVGSG